MGGLYLLDRKGLITIPGLPKPTSRSTSTAKFPQLNIAPQNLPAHVTNRCGTVTVSFGQSTKVPGYVILGRYTNGVLVSQYYQPVSQSGNLLTSGLWVGGYACPSTATHTPISTHTTTPAPSNVYGWKFVGIRTINGHTAKCYVAQNGATLSGLQVITGVYYGTIASQNGISNPNVIQIGQTVCVATGSAASTPKTTPRSGFPQLRVAAQVLPSSVTTNRCGTVYYSYGMSSVAGYAVIAKYVNTKLVAQYYQAATGTSPWRNKGYHTGGSACSGSSVSTSSPSGYFHLSQRQYGVDVYGPAIPNALPANVTIPYSLVQCVWYNLGHTLYVSTKKPVANQWLVAKYSSNGKWTGVWTVLQRSSSPGTVFLGDCQGFLLQQQLNN